MNGTKSKSVVQAVGAKALATYLYNEIASGRLKEGSKLPAERQLSEQFSASRGSVRRVLQTLKEQGLITQAIGSGTFVLPGAAKSLPVEAMAENERSMIQTSPAELMEARLLIEPLMPKLIARNATAADFAQMLVCLEHSEAAQTVEEFEHWDGELHRTFALATHNTFFLKVLELTNQVREQGEWGRLKRHSLTPQRRQDYETQHRTIVEALRDRDADQAACCLTEHLRQIQQNLFGL